MQPATMPRLIGEKITDTAQWTGKSGPLSAGEFLREIDSKYRKAADDSNNQRSIGHSSDWTFFANRMGLSKQQVRLANEKYGFGAMILVDRKPAVIAFRHSGKLISMDRKDWADWLENASNSFCGTFFKMSSAFWPQHRLAIWLADAVRERHRECVLTGHSLGGGLAACAGAYLNIPAITFNSAGNTLPGAPYTQRVLNIVIATDRAGLGGALVGVTVVLDINLLVPTGPTVATAAISTPAVVRHHPGIGERHGLDRFHAIAQLDGLAFSGPSGRDAGPIRHDGPVYYISKMRAPQLAKPKFGFRLPA